MMVEYITQKKYKILLNNRRDKELIDTIVTSVFDLKLGLR